MKKEKSWIECLYAILLSKVIPRHVTLFTKGLFRPFSCSTSSGTLSSGETDRLSFPFFDLYVPRIHCNESPLQFAKNTMFMLLYRVNRGIVSEQSNMSSACGGASLIYMNCTILEQGRNLDEPLLLFSW
jgi:hypothetical protein